MLSADMKNCGAVAFVKLKSFKLMPQKRDNFFSRGLIACQGPPRGAREAKLHVQPRQVYLSGYQRPHIIWGRWPRGCGVLQSLSELFLRLWDGTKNVVEWSRVCG